jgi:hypothetical protein
MTGYVVSCTRNLSVPVNPALVTLTPTSTAASGAPTNTPVPGAPTNTFTPVPAGPTNTFTITNTPVPGAPTNTFTPVPPTATPTTAGPTPVVIPASGTSIIYDNGTSAPVAGCGYCSWNGGGDTAPTANPADTTSSTYPGSETQALSFTFGTIGAGGWSGDTVVSATTTPYENMEAYTHFIFYAKGSIAGPMGFEAIVPETAGSTPASFVVESLTTSWVKYSLVITDGARSDGASNNAPPGTSIADVATWFVIGVQTGTPANDVVYLDAEYCQ